MPDFLTLVFWHKADSCFPIFSQKICYWKMKIGIASANGHEAQWSARVEDEVDSPEINNLAVGVFYCLSFPDLVKHRDTLLTVDKKPNASISSVKRWQNVGRMPKQRLVMPIGIPSQHRTDR